MAGIFTPWEWVSATNQGAAVAVVTRASLQHLDTRFHAGCLGLWQPGSGPSSPRPLPFRCPPSPLSPPLPPPLPPLPSLSTSPPPTPPALSHKLMSAYNPVFSLPFHEHVAKYSQSDPAVCLISNNLPQRQPSTSDSQCQSCKREELIGPDQVSAHPWSSQLLRAAERWVLIGPRRPSRGEAGLRKGRWGLEEHRGCHPTCLPRRTHSEAG